MLSKSYGRNRGITAVTFAIQEGEVFGFLDPNGAGKTTTMRVLLGLLRPSSRSATIGGRACWTQSTQWFSALPRVLSVRPGPDGSSLEVRVQGDLREVLHLAAQHDAVTLTTHHEGLQVLAPAIAIGQPGSVLTAVIKVEVAPLPSLLAG